MSDLEKDLLELFDLKKNMVERENILNQQVADAMKDIKLLTRMFSEGIPCLTIPLSEEEDLIWDGRIKKIVYSKGNVRQFIEAVDKRTIVRVRPYLSGFVKLAKDQLTA